MGSTFGGIELSKRALMAQTRSLNTVGHNISNINTEGYSKQRVMLATMPPLHIPGIRPEIPGQIGQGVDTVAITRQRDLNIDMQIFAQSHKEGYWDTRSQYLSRLESIYNEVGDSSLRNMLDRYWESWQEVSNYPEQHSARIVLLERADTLASAIKDRHGQLQQTRAMLDEEVIHTSNLINQYTKDIATLNHNIKQSESLGDHPNDWLDRRDLLIDKIGQLINITVDRDDPDELLIHTNGKILVQGDYARKFELVRNANDVNTHTVLWQDTQEVVDNTGGTLSSLIDLRDGDVRGEIQSLNTFSINLIDSTNALHRTGVSLTGTQGVDFFVETPAILSAQGNFDSNDDGEFDQSRIYRITGNNEIQLTSIVGFGGQITLSDTIGDQTLVVNYNANDTVQAIIERINGSGAEVVAGLDGNNRLSIHATASNDPGNPDFVIRTIQDSGEFLSGYSGMLTEPGEAGGYNWQQVNAVDALATTAYGVSPFLDPAASMTVNPFLMSQPQQIAASQYAQDGIVDVGDGSIARAIAGLRTENVGFGQEKSFDDYFAESIASVASRGEEAKVHSQTYKLIMEQLRSARQEVSGVSLDEELQDLIKFQAAYGAAAKFLTQLNTMYDALIAVV